MGRSTGIRDEANGNSRQTEPDGNATHEVCACCCRRGDCYWYQHRHRGVGGVAGAAHVADEHSEKYIRESILQSQAAIVQGYKKANRMVDIRKTLNENQIEALVSFLTDTKPK